MCISHTHTHEALESIDNDLKKKKKIWYVLRWKKHLVSISHFFSSVGTESIHGWPLIIYRQSPTTTMFNYIYKKKKGEERTICKHSTIFVSPTGIDEPF